jgi:hypothetical protein
MSFCPTETPLGFPVSQKESCPADAGGRNFRNSISLFMIRNKGGRPPVGDEKRSFKIDVRFTEAEYRQVEQMENELGVRKTELVRRKLLYDGKGLAVNSGELMNRLDLISLELSRSGNNINQLARYANRLQKRGLLAAPVIDEYTRLLRRHQSDQSELAMLFRKLLRSMIP